MSPPWKWSLTPIWMVSTFALVPGKPRWVLGSEVLEAGGGRYWLVPGVAFSLVVAVVNAWILLVEVVR